jgi:hypothetical protein
MAIQRQLKRDGGGDPPEPGPTTQAALKGAGGGESLSFGTRAVMETGLGADLDRVRVHTDRTAAHAAQELRADAFTFGQDIFFGEGQYQPSTAQGRRLLAHELTHTLQQSPGFLPAQSPRVVPADSPAEKEAEASAQAVSSGQVARIGVRVTRPSVARQPKTDAPPATVQLGADLESDDPIAHGAALEELGQQDNEAGWSLLLLAQESRNEDVRRQAKALIPYKVSQQPAFETFLRRLANSPRGALSDLAISALVQVGSGSAVPLENYRNVIHQRLTLARRYFRELDDDLDNLNDSLFTLVLTGKGGPMTRGPSPTEEIDRLDAKVDSLDVDGLWPLGLRASTLLEQVAPVWQVVEQLKAAHAKAGDEDDIRDLIQTQLMKLLLEARKLRGDQNDPAFAEIAKTLGSLPTMFAQAIVDQLHAHFTSAREQIRKTLKDGALDDEGEIAKGNWKTIMKEVVQPVDGDLTAMIEQLEALRSVAGSDAGSVFEKLDTLQPHLRSIGERAQYLQHAGAMLGLYANLKATAAKWRTDTGPRMLSASWSFFSQFLSLASIRDKNPDAAQQEYDRIVKETRSYEGSYKQLLEDAEIWQEVLEAEQKCAPYVDALLILIVSIETGGLAGGLVRGVFGTATTFGGRLAIGALAFGAEVETFTLMNRGLRWMFYGEDFTKGLGGDLLKNALTFGILKGSAAVYARFGAPLLPPALRPAGALTSTFVSFQAWSVGLNFYETKEWIGVTDPRFWKMAAQNAFFLGALHLGMKITQPLIAPVKESVLDFRINRHNQRCAALETQIQTWSSMETPSYREGEGLLRRAQALYRERLDVLSEINRINPDELTAEELRQAEATLSAQIRAVENTLAQSRFNLTAHETAPNTFYYEGDPAALRRHYERQGYLFLELDAPTGRIRLRSPDGQLLDLIRTRETPTETAGPTAEEVAAEQRIAAATTADAYLSALRQQLHRAGSVGGGWDYTRFPRAPRGRAGQWQVGDPIDKPDSSGVYPTYNTARERYWKNRAHFELQARARNEVQHDPTSSDPIRRLSDADLQTYRRTGSAPPAPGFPGRTMELEHSGVPQRVEAWLRELGFSASEARQLAGVSNPGWLLEVLPVEHAFYDVYASYFGAQRADIAGDVWSGTEEADIRRTRPMEPMDNATLTRIVQEAQRRGFNFNRNAATQRLRAALRIEITTRGLSISLP